MKAVNPFPSFLIVLPDGIEEDRTDAHVASYWTTDDTCLLQLSCFGRDSGPQVSAAERVSERVRIGGTWESFDLPRAVVGCETAAARTIDEKGTAWVHAYLVWPWISIHVTVSRQGSLSACEWAWDAVASIRPVLM
jgi:hypothetical protein